MKGQHEIFAEWLAEWQAALAKEGRSIEFQLWDESSLMMRLAAVDTTGGLRRYWFEQETFSSQWFRDRLQDAVAQAGPRYTPDLSIATPLEDALHAFGRSEVWAERVRQVARRYSDKVDWWRRTAEGRTDDLLTAIPQIFSARAKALLGAAEIVDAGLDTTVDSPETLTKPSFTDGLRRAAELAEALEPIVKAALLEQHGQNADSRGFRQFHAEYMVNFPMAPLDHLRALRSALEEVETLAFKPGGQLPSATSMLIRGEAGI